MREHTPTPDTPHHEDELLQQPRDNHNTPLEPTQEEDKDATPTPQATVRLYTDSDIDSPSIHATPEQPLRKGSFSFAPLPARDSIKQSLGARVTDIKPIADVPPSSSVQPIRQQSLGLDSDDEQLDDAESVDLRAPELIAHEERMREYDTPPPATETEIPEPEEPENIIGDTNDASSVHEPELEEPENIVEEINDASSEDESPEESDTKSKAREVPIETTSAAPRPSQVRAPTTRRLAAPKTFGRPVRPTNVTKPQPVPIKIKPLSQPKPINPAPVAAHNTSKQQPVPEKLSALEIARRKKIVDEQAAARDAQIKQQQKERRDNKIEELRRNKQEEEAQKDQQARENSAEKRKLQTEDMEQFKKLRRSFSPRQKREEATAAAKKQAFRAMQQKRQIRPATKPVAKPAVKSAMKPAATLASRPQNPPPRPPTRLDNHDPSRPASRLELHDEDMNELPEKENDLPAYPSNLSKPPVRASIKKPSIFTRTSQNIQQQFPQPPTRVAPQMQQYATQRIPFATEIVPQRNQENLRPQIQAGPSMNTPFAPMRNMHTIQAINDTSPTDITLPEIHTDSSDDSDRNVSLPSWATPGHVFNTLSQQETINPDVIFPRIPTISMDDVFAENPDRLRRLRMRTSSANWVRTGDALTQVEVLDDRIGRANIRNAGMWFYGAGNAQNGNYQ